MKEEKINISIDKELYEEANDLYNALGLDMESAIRVFLLASLREDGLPFMLKFDDCYCDDCDCDDCDCEEHDCHCQKKISN